MTVHSGLKISDMLQTHARKSEKSIPSSSGDDFASMLALYTGKDSGDGGLDAVRLPEKTKPAAAHEKPRDAGTDDRKVSTETEKSHKAVQKEKDADNERGNRVNEKSKKAETSDDGKSSKAGKEKAATGVKTGKMKILPKVAVEKKAGNIKGTQEKTDAAQVEIKHSTTKKAAVNSVRRLTRHTGKNRKSSRVLARIAGQSIKQKTGVTSGVEEKIELSVKKKHRDHRRSVKIAGARKRLTGTQRPPHLQSSFKSLFLGDSQKLRASRHTVDIPAALRYENLMHNVASKSHYQFHKIADGNFEEIVRQFTLILNRGGGEARLHLHPESLGELKLSIKLHNHEVSTNMLVDSQSVKDLILQRLAVLEESLLKQGFQLGSFQVEVKDRQNDSYGVSNGMGGGVVSPEEEIAAEDVPVMPPWMSTMINLTV